MSHRFFSLPSSGGQELHCILCKWQPLELCTHNLYIHGWGHWSTSVLSLLAPKWTLAWSTKSTDFILSAIDALSHSSEFTCSYDQQSLTIYRLRNHGLFSIYLSLLFSTTGALQAWSRYVGRGMPQSLFWWGNAMHVPVSQKFPRRIKPCLPGALTCYFVYTL